jgi:hypothetical protein
LIDPSSFFPFISSRMSLVCWRAFSHEESMYLHSGLIRLCG